MKEEEEEVKDAILCNGVLHRNPPNENCDSKHAIENKLCETYLDGRYPYCSDCFPNLAS